MKEKKTYSSNNYNFSSKDGFLKFDKIISTERNINYLTGKLVYREPLRRGISGKGRQDLSSRVEYKLTDIYDYEPKIETYLLFKELEKVNPDFFKLIDLLKNGADVNSINHDGNSPIHFAANLCENRIFTNILLKYGANPNATNNAGLTPLLIASESKYDCNDVIKALIKHGALIDKTEMGTWPTPGSSHPAHPFNEGSHHTSIRISAWRRGTYESPLVKAIKNNKIELVKLLIESGANIEMENIKKNMKPLDYAIVNRNFDMIKLLLESGANIIHLSENVKDFLLVQAIELNKIELVKLLVDLGVDNIETERFYQISPFIIAIKFNRLDIIKLLVKLGANIERIDKKNNFSPLKFAIYYNNIETIKLLVELGAKIYENDIKLAIDEKKDEIVKFLNEKIIYKN